MIILDTNIISELMKTTPDSAVVTWLDQQTVTQLHITTISIAEISYGINVLTDSKRRDTLENSFQHALDKAFKHRILSFMIQLRMLTDH